jgi:hypothetical protein
MSSIEYVHIFGKASGSQKSYHSDGEKKQATLNLS